MDRTEICVTLLDVRSRGSSVGVVTSLRAGRSGVWIPAEASDLSLIHNMQNSSGADPASCSVGAGGYPRRERSRIMRVTCRLRLVSKLWMSGAIHPLPQYSFMAFTGTALPFAPNINHGYQVLCNSVSSLNIETWRTETHGLLWVHVVHLGGTHVEETGFFLGLLDPWRCDR